MKQLKDWTLEELQNECSKHQENCYLTCPLFEFCNENELPPLEELNINEIGYAPIKQPDGCFDCKICNHVLAPSDRYCCYCGALINWYEIK